MVQLSSKVTFARVWNTCKTCLKCVRDVSGTRMRCVRANAKPHDKAAARLTQLSHLFCQTRDVSRTRAGRAQMIPWN